MIATPAILDEIGQLSMAELDALPLAELDDLIRQVSEGFGRSNDGIHFLE